MFYWSRTKLSLFSLNKSQGVIHPSFEALTQVTPHPFHDFLWSPCPVLAALHRHCRRGTMFLYALPQGQVTRVGPPLPTCQPLRHSIRRSSLTRQMLCPAPSGLSASHRGERVGDGRGGKAGNWALLCCPPHCLLFGTLSCQGTL
jgi:hypothetical protein